MQTTMPAPRERRPAAEVSGRYCFSWGNQFYESWKNGRPVTLGECLTACYGVGAARIWRINGDGTLALVVERAGSDVEIVYAPTGRRIRRRPARQVRTGCP